MPKNDFFTRVYQVAELIPFGRVTSYGAIARYLGSTRSARMVGWAMNKCSTWHHYIPAHRVVNRNGLLTGKMHFPGGDTMIELLQNEGIVVEENQITNFREVFWDPSVELENEV